ncbi:hypothetical protein COC69_05835 [Bacillus cereus]|uniref:Uncharacterized protein n=1 Tax=Bacillus cereus TaxID=1396 RepID=A0A9X7CQV2_BACCE|nr:hypothetical protein [Bacillus cereus]PGS81649.1 hypothetical protein COC69_05835 [Bacillus cereus]
MSEQKYYVKLVEDGFDKESYRKFLWMYDDKCTFQEKDYDEKHRPDRLFRFQFTKSELAEIMDGKLYRTFTHQFDPQLAEELYILGFKTTQTTEEWVKSGYEFDNVWEWTNPIIELVPVED